MMNFAFSLRMWRQRRQFSQVALAHKAGVTQATLSRLEMNQEKPRWETLQRLASALRVETQELLLHKPPPQLKLDKFDVDAIGRAVVSGKRELSPALNRLTDEIASRMINKLQAHQAPGYRRVAGLRSLAPFRKFPAMAEMPESLRDRLLIRAHRMLSLADSDKI